MTAGYNEIEHKGGLSHCRSRPGMYVGDTEKNEYTSALMNMLREVIGNAADEFANEYATQIRVVFDSHFNTLRVEDDGRGIPFGPTQIENPFVEGQRVDIDKLELATGVPNTGAKYAKGDDKSFKFAIGMNGIGLKATNALSEKFCVTVHRAEGSRYIEYAKGKITVPVKEIPADPYFKHGTRVQWNVDQTLLPFQYTPAHLRRYLHEVAYLNAGLKILLEIDTKEEVFYEPEGILAMLRDMVGKTMQLMSFPMLTLAGDFGQVEIALSVAEGAGESIHPFVNGSSIENTSTPVVALRQSFARTLAGYVKDHVQLPKKYAKLSIEPADFRSGLYAVIKTLHEDPTFDSQTKTKLTNTDVAALINAELPNKLLAVLLANPDAASKLVQQALIQAQAREAAQKAREAVTKAADKFRDDITVSLDIYTAPLTYNPDYNALYLFEGQSAAGSLVKASKARNPDTGKLYKEHIGILALKGMVLNTLDLDLARAMKNTELATLIKVSGLNPKDPSDLSGLNFRYFYITTDMDAGGAHIAILLSSFFLTHFPRVIEEGRLARVITPLFELKDLKTKQVHFIYPDVDKDAAIAALGYKPEEVNKRYTLKRNKGLGELSDRAKMTLVDHPRLQILQRTDLEPMRKLFGIFSGDKTVGQRRQLIFGLGLLEDEAA